MDNVHGVSEVKDLLLHFLGKLGEPAQFAPHYM
jgi:hypothetical protein